MEKKLPQMLHPLFFLSEVEIFPKKKTPFSGFSASRPSPTLSLSHISVRKMCAKKKKGGSAPPKKKLDRSDIKKRTKKADEVCVGCVCVCFVN